MTSSTLRRAMERYTEYVSGSFVNVATAREFTDTTELEIAVSAVMPPPAASKGV
jgi:hypothetical protein